MYIEGRLIMKIDTRKKFYTLLIITAILGIIVTSTLNILEGKNLDLRTPYKAIFLFFALIPMTLTLVSGINLIRKKFLKNSKILNVIVLIYIWFMRIGFTMIFVFMLLFWEEKTQIIDSQVYVTDSFESITPNVGTEHYFKVVNKYLKENVYSFSIEIE